MLWQRWLRGAALPPSVVVVAAMVIQRGMALHSSGGAHLQRLGHVVQPHMQEALGQLAGSGAGPHTSPSIALARARSWP